MSIDGMENLRIHCDDEMDYLGKNSQGHGFGCKHCEHIEYYQDPDAPIQPIEPPRKSALSYGTETTMGKKNYGK